MYSQSNQQQMIQQIIKEEIECAHKLIQSLDLEYEALAGHHAAVLEDVVRDKQGTIQQLELISRQREKLLTVFDGVTVSKDSENNTDYQFHGNGQLTDLWNELIDAAEKCRDKNRVNGSIVELVSKQSRHALDILQGILPDASPVSELYDNAGQTTKSANKRSLVQV
jgi:flagellar biosynthesis/type III secretory pathway chaperone